MNQNTEVTYFLGDFVKYYCDGRCDTYRNTYQITRSENQTINEIMDSITDKIHDGKGVDVCLGNRHMTVISMNNFLCNETKKDTAQNTERCFDRNHTTDDCLWQ